MLYNKYDEQGALINQLEAENARLKEELEHELNNRDNLREELAAAQLDAARYRWLRTNKPIHDNAPFIARNFGASFSQWTNEYADAAIDAAMQGEKK